MLTTTIKSNIVYKSDKISNSVKSLADDNKKDSEEADNIIEDDSILLYLNHVDWDKDLKFSENLSKVKKKVKFSSKLVQDVGEDQKSKKSSKSLGRKANHISLNQQNTTKSSLKRSSSGYQPEIESPLWSYTHTKWGPRLVYLSEIKQGRTKNIKSKFSDTSTSYCENQGNLILGTGPDFSNIILGVMDECHGVVVKKINIKRAQRLLDENIVKSVISLPIESSLAKVFYISRDKTHFYIVRELCENSIKHVIKMRQFVPESVRQPLNSCKLCYDIANAVSVLHSQNLVHMSLKPENIFVGNDGDIKLTDYWIHERTIARKKQYTGEAAALCFLPHEALDKNITPVTFAYDIASLGILFYYIITEGGHPFGDSVNAPDACLKNILHGHYNLKAISDPFAHHLIRHMIFKEPEKRMPIDQVLKHPYFWSEYDKNKFVRLLAAVVSFESNEVLQFSEAINVLPLVEEKSLVALQSSSVSCEDFNTVPNLHSDKLISLLLYTNSHLQTKNQNGSNAAKKLWSVFPGVILELYQCINTDDLTALAGDIESYHNLSSPEYRTLKPTLSADSGITSPGYDVPYVHDDYLINGLTIETAEYKRQRNISDCCTSGTDDGIDMLSPLCGSLTEGNLFSSPVKISQNNQRWGSEKGFSNLLSPESCSSSVDNHFEFDGIESLKNKFAEINQEAHCKEFGQETKTKMHLWTDIDELD